MRNNQPVNDHEYQVKEGQILVSKTDLAGTILECNDAFEAASGFTRAELIGQPHNIIRHPDVPSAVFADMWQDLKHGRPWTQFVKNRRKDGGYYWVKAQATPLFENGRVTGYMSIRSCATEAEKQAAAQAYQAIAAGKAGIRHGQITTGPSMPNLNPFTRLSPVWLLAVIGVIFSVIPTALATAGLVNFAAEASLVMSLILLGAMVGYGRFVTHTIDNAIGNLRRIASKQNLPEKNYDPTTFFGKLRNAEVSLNLAFLESREESAYQLDQAQQIKLAMDKMQTNVMMVDHDYNIMYLNDSMKAFFAAGEDKIKEVVPAFDMATIEGANIDLFHSTPSHQRKMLDAMKEPDSITLTLAGIHLKLNMIPIHNRSGVRTAMLVEWIDRTQEAQLLDSVHQVVGQAQKGHLGRRIDLSDVEGVAHDLSHSINDLLDAIQDAMNEVVRVTTGMAEGDLTQVIDKPYEGELGELKEAVNSSISRLDGIVSVAVEAAKVVDSASREVSQGSTDLSDRVQQQAAAIEQTSATMDEMNAAIKNNTDNANQASSVATDVQSKAREGSEVMTETIEAMGQIQDSSHKISEIVTMIDSIAFQTNLLALNAAVEAARAGEHGRGFAVVAGEVRSLSQKSAEAAKDITALIDESTKRIDHGTKLASRSGEFLNTIVGSVDEITSMIKDIAKASNEQATGIHQVHDAITDIDQVTQQNAALVDETTAASKSMSEQAKILSDDMAYFKTTGNATSAPGLTYRKRD
ncbi:methyl-accepting chemotaxis protein [Hydrogenovibrio halophilus]|uniref:methyl-accepting chemotaxis protein n=1 Tax=Hydrogenovibrio halophilus TaxID=373391 RepID=UPI000366CC57|nr:methyl-accepting chemotaxis protein [Hydrogenovibrio halophilus]